MRTRTFLGLILLVAALLVASTPQLLEPASSGVEQLAIRAGVMQDPVAALPHRLQRTGKGSKAAPPETVLKGYQVNRTTGDLQDLSNIGARGTPLNRLPAGMTRVNLPGTQHPDDPYNPPVQSKGGILLDIDGCPVFPAGTDIATLVADPVNRQRYANKAASAINPAACRTALDAQIKKAVSPTGFALPGDRREVESSVRSDSQRLMFDLYTSGLYEELFAGWVAAPQKALKIKSNLAAAG